MIGSGRLLKLVMLLQIESSVVEGKRFRFLRYENENAHVYRHTTSTRIDFGGIIFLGTHLCFFRLTLLGASEMILVFVGSLGGGVESGNSDLRREMALQTSAPDRSWIYKVGWQDHLTMLVFRTDEHHHGPNIRSCKRSTRLAESALKCCTAVKGNRSARNKPTPTRREHETSRICQ